MKWVKESAPVQRRAAAAFLLVHSLPNEGAKRRQPSGSRTDPLQSADLSSTRHIRDQACEVAGQLSDGAQIRGLTRRLALPKQ